MLYNKEHRSKKITGVCKMNMEYDYYKNTVLDILRDGVKTYGDRVLLRNRTDNGWIDVSWNQVNYRLMLWHRI